ncbi:MAG: hypothetical protein NXH75_11965 [Halobacteriovoraceae bacterium]|nr:hypothetical protein [Halobacteriovoraceae bacterium]
MKLTTLLLLSCFLTASCNPNRELVIQDPVGSSDEVKVPAITPVRQDGNTRLVRRAIDSSDPCFEFLEATDTIVLASCYVVLDGLVSPAFPETVPEVSLCVMKKNQGDKEFLSLEGNLLSEREDGSKVRHYFSKTSEFKIKENILKVSFIQGKHKVWFDYVDQGVKDYPLLKFTRRTKVFRKRINKAAFECFPEYIPED